MLFRAFAYCVMLMILAMAGSIFISHLPVFDVGAFLAFVGCLVAFFVFVYVIDKYQAAEHKQRLADEAAVEALAQTNSEVQKLVGRRKKAASLRRDLISPFIVFALASWGVHWLAFIVIPLMFGLFAAHIYCNYIDIRLASFTRRQSFDPKAPPQ